MCGVTNTARFFIRKKNSAIVLCSFSFCFWIYMNYLCVCVCVFLFTKQIMWKFTQNLFDSVLFCTGEEESPISELLYSIFLSRFFFSSYVGLINNLRVSAFACISYVNVCVYIKMNVNLSFLCFFFHGKIMRGWQTFAKDNL